MNDLIEDLLNLSRVTRQELKLEQVDLSSIAGRYGRFLSDRDPDRAVDVIIAPDLKAGGDARLLRLALENLLDNTWKFTGKTAKARIEFGAFENSSEKVFYIRDNGAGFPGQQASRLFTPFSRLHSEKEFPGTGVGLSIVCRVIKRHGGKIWAEGEISRGAAFFFTFPLVDNDSV